jgi:preprotein translocase subunit SecG
MQTVIIVIHLMIVATLIGVVLLQRSEGGGLGMGSGGGGGGGFMTGRGTANLLTRTTAFLAIGFFITSLFLSWLAGLERKPASIIDTAAPVAPVTQPGAPAPPVSGSGTGGGVLDMLRQQDQRQAPGGPQPPRPQ